MAEQCKHVKNNRESFGPSLAVVGCVTGLAIAAPSEGSLGALLGGVPPSTPVLPVPGALAFLDLLGLLGGPAPNEDDVATEAAPEWGTESAPLLALNPVASLQVAQTPQQIAVAVIRSMLRPAATVPVEVEATDGVAVVSPRAQDDWDVPLDWTAPEEGAWEEEEVPSPETVLHDLQPGPVAFAPPASVSIPVSKPVPEPGPALQADVLKSAAAGAMAKPVEQGVPVVTERAKLVASMPGPEPAAPLAFAMRLSSTADASGAKISDKDAAPSLSAEVRQSEASRPAAEIPQSVQRELPAEVVGTESLAESGPVVMKAEKTEAAPSASSERTLQRVAATEVPNEKSGGKNDSESEDRKPSASPIGRVKASKIAPARTEFPVQQSAAVVPAGVVRQSPPASQRPLEIATPAAEGTTQPVAEPTIAPPRTGTSHEIAVRVSGPDAAPVDLQVRERGGTVHVAVRTADGALQTALRQDVGALMDRLEQSGLRTEAVVTQDGRPRAETAMNLADGFRVHGTQAAAASAQSETFQERDGSGAREQNPSGRQQNPQRRQSPAQQQKWLQSMLAQRMENQA